jgi:sodium-independent sulfate anion transporter 11
MLTTGEQLEFVSAPVLAGWISAVALVILLGQVGGLVGLTTRRETDQIIRDVLVSRTCTRPPRRNSPDQI